ncbi:response regulator transcription factor [Pedobacter sp. MR2016-19]|uniref:LytR/AlgR family response regulator transcription factor n=1 Tax=Pedobacter sp. MR2016-19 TaxID=2780089 RepID=UPI001875CD8D|nr:LytTR family DNA-binding domain-containing protein [Pedobacter sp. MR2016-19]MBE5321599.1 response regulator transcription factor [Pedobacter sp. MR2016-19]
MINCIAIDDQYSSLVGLQKYIEDTPNMRLVQQYTDPITALRELATSEMVDIIFMDVEMPQISGLELAKAIRFRTRKLIFTTSHQEYAFDAFEAAGDAYLLKPYSYAKFATTITRLFGHEMTGGANEDYFLVKNKEEEHRAVMVKYEDIIAFESFHNYIKLHTLGKIIIAYLSLKDVREQLSIKNGFIQLHRGYIVAIDKILYIDGNRITMNNNISFTVGDIYYNEFKSFISERLIISSRKK